MREESADFKHVTETLSAKESKLCNVSHILSSKIWWVYYFVYHLTFPWKPRLTRLIVLPKLRVFPENIIFWLTLESLQHFQFFLIIFDRVLKFDAILTQCVNVILIADT